MKHTNKQIESKLKVEFDSRVSGIGVSPKVIHFFNTKYSKILSIRFPKSSNELSGRLVPVPASYHDRHVVVLPESWKLTYGIKDDDAICKICEPSFANKVSFKRIEKHKEDALPVINDEITDKSLIFKGMCIRENGVLFEIVSIDGELQEAILTEKTSLDFPTDNFTSENKEGNNSDSTLKSKIENKTNNLSVGSKPLSFENLHKLKGIEKIIQQLKDEVVHPYLEIIHGKIKNPKPMGGVLLYGPPGCGKTEIAHSLAQDLGIDFIPVTIGELASPYVHQFAKNLQNVFLRAKKSKNGAIIFLDELDAIAAPRSDLNDLHDKENVNALLQELDPKRRGEKVLVFAATNYLSHLDTAVTRSGRFDTKIAVLPPNEDARAEILRSKLNDHPIDHKSITEGFVKQYASKTVGFVGADLATMIEKASTFKKIRSQKIGISPEDAQLNKSDVKKAFDSITPLSETSLQIKKPTISKSDLPGSENYIDEICREAHYLLNRSSFRSDIKYKPNQAFLLFGPPGTGKTSIAHAAANELNVLFKVVNANDLSSQFSNKTSKNIRELFEKLRLFRPILVFFDEIDSIAKVRKQDERHHESESINALLTQFGDTVDNDKIIFVGATNRLEILDPALLRSGRFGTHIEVNAPKKDQIVKQLEKHLEEIPHSLNKVDIDSIAESLYNRKFTQADIANYTNKIKHFMVFNTNEDVKADLKLLKNLLDK